MSGLGEQECHRTGVGHEDRSELVLCEDSRACRRYMASPVLVDHDASEIPESFVQMLRKPGVGLQLGLHRRINPLVDALDHLVPALAVSVEQVALHAFALVFHHKRVDEPLHCGERSIIACRPIFDRESAPLKLVRLAALPLTHAALA